MDIANDEPHFEVFGFSLEELKADIPQPYGEIFVSFICLLNMEQDEPLLMSVLTIFSSGKPS